MPINHTEKEKALPLVWVIEDEPDIANILARVINSCCGYPVIIHSPPFNLLEALQNEPPDLVFTDLVMPDCDGFEVIKKVSEFSKGILVVVISAYSTIDNAVNAVKLGAFDFLPKPFDPDSVRLILAKMQREFDQRAHHADLIKKISANDSYIRAIKGNSQHINDLHKWIIKVRNVKTNVLIYGESGTGKELVTRAIHAGNGPFVAINMAAIPEDLADSELFGHKQGAFTGATTERSGLLLEANEGTLFLDEVNAMSMHLQAKLLRVIEERKVRPVGSNHERNVEFRLISATNEDLEKLVDEGRFRRDLYHRLKVLSVNLSPLRERIEDITLLANEFLQYYARAHDSSARRFSDHALELLKLREWPGNVRELENLIEEAVILTPTDVYEISSAFLNHNLDRNELDEKQQLTLSSGELITLANLEKLYVQKVLEHTNGNKAQAARILKIDYKTLVRKVGV